ncbi:L-dopachrome tautomerase-related protein [Rubrobacter aplysinae]|uniref:L-dopachrome tautomerase-related protein n=1 Tax=Rubrobacter aplysinae TaxID=909625 RepID=UPI00064BC3F2|nr:L-dopachrome tautomerase-related protein [Rubrobacter aplysinae]
MTDTRGVATTELEVMVRLDERPGNPAITPEGRMILSLHPFPHGEASPYRVVEVLHDGSTVPFPNEEWSTAPDSEGVGLSAVIGVQSDSKGVVWILDIGGGENPSPKLVAWDTRKDELHRVIHVPPDATRYNSFQQDLAIDEAHDAIFIADVCHGDLFGTSDPAIVAVDLETGSVRRALQDHPSLQPEEDVSLVIGGHPLLTLNPQGELEESKIGLDPIVIDHQNEWVYYGALHGKSIFRVRAADLLDESLSEEELGSRVQRHGDKPISDGISIDTAGNVYVTDLASNAIGITAPDGSYHILTRDDEHCIWPDGMSHGPDGYLYVTASQLHRSAPLNAGEEVSEPPFEVLRFRPLAPGAVGR